MTIKLQRQINQKVTNKVAKAVKKLSTETELEKIGEEAIQQIQLRTFRGKGVNSRGGPEGEFIELSPSTLRAKKRKGDGRTKARLTDTGEMLRSIKQIIRNGTITLFVAGIRKNGMSNNELADIHQNQGAGKSKVKRPFFNLSGKEIKKLTKLVRLRLKSLLQS